MGRILFTIFNAFAHGLWHRIWCISQLDFFGFHFHWHVCLGYDSKFLKVLFSERCRCEFAMWLVKKWMHVRTQFAVQTHINDMFTRRYMTYKTCRSSRYVIPILTLSGIG
jgi:hypothetical protein